MSGYNNPNEVSARESHVARQVALADKAIAELIASIDLIEERLVQVLREKDQVKATPGDPMKQPECLVPLASALSVKVDQINGQIARLNSIRNRIEI